MADAKELGDNQNAVLSINPLNKRGNPAQVQAGSVIWAISDTAMAELTPFVDDNGVTDEKKQRIKALGTLGGITVTVDADADLGEGVTAIQDALDITIKAGPALNLGLAMDQPVDNTDVPPA